MAKTTIKSPLQSGEKVQILARSVARFGHCSEQAVPPQSVEEDLIGRWQDALKLRVASSAMSANTTNTYRIGVVKWIDWLNTNNISHPTPGECQKFVAEMISYASPGSVHTWFAGIRAFYTWCTQEGLLALQDNPTQRVKGPKRKGANKHHKRDAFTDEEMKRILALPLSARDRAIVALKAYTGLRDVSVHLANHEDLHTRSGHRVLLYQSKGHGEKDEIAKISSPLEVILNVWLDERGRSPGPLFVSLSDRNKDGRLSLSAMRRIVKDLLRSIGIDDPRKTSHSFRHTAATKALRATKDIRRVQAMMGHESIETTMIYAHDLDRLENAAEDAIVYE